MMIAQLLNWQLFSWLYSSEWFSILLSVYLLKEYLIDRNSALAIIIILMINLWMSKWDLHAMNKCEGNSELLSYVIKSMIFVNSELSLALAVNSWWATTISSHTRTLYVDWLSAYIDELWTIFSRTCNSRIWLLTILVAT